MHHCSIALMCCTGVLVPHHSMNPMMYRRFSSVRAELRELTRELSRLSTEQDIEAFLRDLLTHQEIRTVTDRWVIAKLVHSGFPYRAINSKTGASSSTIARVIRSMQSGTGILADCCKNRQQLLAQKFGFDADELYEAVEPE